MTERYRHQTLLRLLAVFCVLLACALALKPARAEIGWHIIYTDTLPCGGVHAYTQDYLGTAPGSMEVEYLEYYHWRKTSTGKWHGEVIEGTKADIDAALAADNARLKTWIKTAMTADVVGDYRDDILLADGTRCEGFNENGFPDKTGQRD